VAGITDNELVDEELLPPVETAPPYTRDFIAHLHGDCYPADVTSRVLPEVRGALDGARVLDELESVRLALAVLGSRTLSMKRGRLNNRRDAHTDLPHRD
jgi:hypothetical protein